MGQCEGSVKPYVPGRSTAFASVGEGHPVLAACETWKGLLSNAPSLGRRLR